VKKQHYTRKEQVSEAFKKYVPEAFVELVVDLFLTFSVKFKIVNGRKTKLGDFRAGLNQEKHQITVNGDLNPYAFLITTLHEFAHLQTFNAYQSRVAPHGEEWKTAYRNLLLPVIQSKHLPGDIQKALEQALINTKASSCTDHHLSRVLHAYDKPKEGVVLLERLPKNTTFVLNGRHFIKGPLRRKRYVCQEVTSSKSYLVNALAHVYPLENRNNE
jgi:SprT protein